MNFLSENLLGRILKKFYFFLLIEWIKCGYFQNFSLVSIYCFEGNEFVACVYVCGIEFKYRLRRIMKHINLVIISRSVYRYTKKYLTLVRA